MWGNALQQPHAWNGVAARLPMSGTERCNPFAFIRLFGRAMYRSPLVYGVGWCKGIDMSFEIYQTTLAFRLRQHGARFARKCLVCALVLADKSAYS